MGEHMIAILKLVYAGVLVCMLTVVGMSIMRESLFAIPPAVTNDPWFVATLFDAYFAFFSFYLWVCYREKSIPVKVIWFFAIAGLGNIAMAIYVLIALFKLKPGQDISSLFSSGS